MIDIVTLREKTTEYKGSLKNRNKENLVSSVDDALNLDLSRRELIQQVEKLRSQRNEISSKISGKDDTELIEQASQIKAELQEIEPKLEETEKELSVKMDLLPNWYHEDTVIGKDDEENEVLKTWGETPSFDFEVKDHVDLGEALDLIDIETSAIVSGSRFNYLKNEAVLMQMGLMQFVFQTLGDREIIGELASSVENQFDKPFVPILPPVILNADVAKKMARFDPIEDRYYFPEDDQLLVGSAEHTLGPMFMDTTFEEDDLPLRYIGYSTAFRREAGTYGKDTRGILRRHQFDKLEMESFSTKEQGLKEQELIVAIQEYLVQKLEIPYQVVDICTGDMGTPDYKQIDINCWIPGQNTYRETHTSDYMTDYQSRRLGTRYRTKQGESHFVHMNDATAFALGRILIAIIENYQQADGSVVIPKILQQYVGKEVIQRS